MVTCKLRKNESWLNEKKNLLTKSTLKDTLIDALSSVEDHYVDFLSDNLLLAWGNLSLNKDVLRLNSKQLSNMSNKQLSTKKWSF